MERKIMSLGKSSLVISLPHEWMKINELKKGDAVSFLIQSDHSLVVYPSTQKKAEIKEITLSIGANEEEIFISQKILGAFLNGYTGIRLASEKIFTVPQTKAIRNMAGRLFMRVMESDSKGVYMQSLTDESQASLQQAIQRMHMISRSMCEGAISAIPKHDIALAKSVYSLDDDVDHFAFFILRILRNAAQNPILAKELHIEPLDCMDYQILVYRMEHTADYAANIAKNLIMIDGSHQKIPSDLSDLIVATGIETIDLYVKSVSAFFSQDVPFAVEIMKSQQRMEKLYIEIASKTFAMEQKSSELVCAICTLRDNIRRIAHCALSIAEVAVNRAFKPNYQISSEEPKPVSAEKNP
jgi:phosphate uptake regulator